MFLRRILLLWIFTIFIVGVAIATETNDVDETINDIDDSLTAIDIALDGNDMLQKQLDDPTNATLLSENVKDILTKPMEPLIGDIDNPNPETVKNNVLGSLYFGIVK